MKTLFSYLVIMFVILFWILRVVVTLAATAGASFVLTPLNTNIEIVLLFVTLVCIVLIIKRNMIGAVIYLLSYGVYFGVDLYTNVSNILNRGSCNIKLYIIICFFYSCFDSIYYIFGYCYE